MDSPRSTLADAFGKFEHDFGSPREPLLMNYRSAPELVSIQAFTIEELDPTGEKQESGGTIKEAVGSAETLVFPDHQTEARFMADEIRSFLAGGTLCPRDICVLTKQKPEVYAQPLIDALAQHNIKARIENELQDLLAEPVTELVVAYLRLATQSRAPREWQAAVEFACAAQTIDPHSRAAGRVGEGLARTITSLRAALEEYSATEDAVRAITQKVLGLIDVTALRQANLQIPSRDIVRRRDREPESPPLAQRAAREQLDGRP